VPSHASKEVVVILGALTSCDPGNIFKTIDVSILCNIRGEVSGERSWDRMLGGVNSLLSYS